jgi:hypothetical protein
VIPRGAPAQSVPASLAQKGGMGAHTQSGEHTTSPGLTPGSVQFMKPHPIAAKALGQKSMLNPVSCASNCACVTHGPKPVVVPELDELLVAPPPAPLDELLAVPPPAPLDELSAIPPAPPPDELLEAIIVPPPGPVVVRLELTGVPPPPPPVALPPRPFKVPCAQLAATPRAAIQTATVLRFTMRSS